MPIVSWLVAGLASVVAVPQEEPGAPAVPVRLLPHAELSKEIARIADEHPDVATAHLVGRSREGREIEALRLTGPGDDSEERPAILLVTNLEGPRVFESGVALHHAERLAAGYADDERIRALLDSTVVWIVPRANPDAAEARFQTPRQERWAGTTGVDDDRDGREGEDPPSDVNGDGLVTWMRVPDPDGTWMPDPTDARASVEADRNKGERGMWKIYPEGRDLDGDELVAEDAPGDVRVDRNFPAGWEEHMPYSGLFATDEPEARALADLVVDRKNIALVVTYDGLDDLVEKPKSVEDDAQPVKRVPKWGVLESDAKLLEEIGKRYREATGNESKGSGEDAGTFARWCYEHRGLMTLEAVLWNMPTEAPAKQEGEEEEEGAAEKPSGEQEEPAETEREHGDRGAKGKKEEQPEPSEDAKRLKWIDGSGESWRFVDWTPFEHPELGPVEIGGFAPYALLEPPEDERQEIADRHLDFFLGLGGMLPRVALAECTEEELGDGVWRVTAVVENDALLPLLSRSARRTGTIRPARVKIVLPEAATLLAGSPQELLSDLPGSGGRHELTWLVKGPEGMELGVEVDTDHAGHVFEKAEVKP